MEKKRESWLVFYRTKSRQLGCMEVGGNLTKEEAIDKVKVKRKLTNDPSLGWRCLEYSQSGPIVKRLCYGKE